MIIEWLHDAKEAPSASRASDGSFAAVDAAGHVYTWRTSSDGPELAVYGPADNLGIKLGTLPHDGSVTLWPDPTGSRLVEIGLHTVSLVRVDGTLVWRQWLAGGDSAVWLADGAIALVASTGIVRLDAATGVPQVARCGWQFGLTTTPHPSIQRTETVCSQL
jgi:hypothetical protein